MTSNFIRIFTGKYSGKSIKTSSHPLLRPTLNRVRSAIFDVLQARLDFSETCFIDGFAGSGAVGVEALSRGFEYCIFIEKDRGLFKQIRKNLSFVESDKFLALNKDIFKSLDIKITLDAIVNFKYGVLFLDPPYTKQSFEFITQKLTPKLKNLKNYLVVIQMPVNMRINLGSNYFLWNKKKYGITNVLFFEPK